MVAHLDTPPTHASCVAHCGRAVLILGASGSGKSTLALQLMAYGAALVADDRVHLVVRDHTLYASAPPPIAGMIEARGFGVLQADHVQNVPVALAVSLDQPETHRMPPERRITFLGCELPLFYGATAPHLAEMIFQYLKTGLRTP